MARLLENMARDKRPGPFRPIRSVIGTLPTALANDNSGQRIGFGSALPADAVALVEPFPVATNQGGHARRGQWRVRFAPRVPSFVDPLTGWTGARNPLTQTELSFADREAAERYCRREHLRFAVQGASPSSALKR
jgi:hypothetical protein